MKKENGAQKASTVLSLLAAVCYLITFFMNRELMNLVLGCIWIVIATEEYIRNKKKGNE